MSWGDEEGKKQAFVKARRVMIIEKQTLRRRCQEKGEGSILGVSCLLLTSVTYTTTQDVLDGIGWHWIRLLFKKNPRTLGLAALQLGAPWGLPSGPDVSSVSACESLRHRLPHQFSQSGTQALQD